MDEFNNNQNPFDEQKDNSQGMQDAYQNDPYNQQPGQNVNPYNQPNANPYAQQNPNPYNQPNTNPYAQQNSNPYNQPYNQPQNGGYTYQNTPQQGYVPPQQGYGMPYQPYPQNASTGMAIASLVLGIVSIMLSLFSMAFPALLLIPIIGIILGIVFKCKHLPVGKGMSTAGIITSIFGLVIPIAIIIIAVVVLLTNGREVMEFIKSYSPEEFEELYELYGEQFPQWFEGLISMFIK